MQNKINIVNAILQDKRKGYPYGAGDAYKMIPHLFARIEELENALAPFATVAGRNLNVPPDGGLQLVQWADLINALAMMDDANSAQVRREDFFDAPAQ